MRIALSGLLALPAVFALTTSAFASIAGTYNGQFKSNGQNQEIQILIAPSMMGPGGKTLTGSVRLIGAIASEASFTGTYSADTGQLVATIPIPDENLSLKIAATLKGTHLSGTISSDQSAGGGTFDASLNAPLALAPGSNSTRPPSYVSKFTGTGKDPDCSDAGHACEVALTLDSSQGSSADAFASAVIGVSNVVANIAIKLGQGEGNPPVEVSYSIGGSNGTAVLDRNRGTLLGSAQSDFGGPIKLDCQAQGATPGNSWSCSLGNIAFLVAPSR